MGIGISIFLIAVGAIMRFAVTATTEGFNVHAAGIVLMIVGALGLVLSLVFWSSWGGFHRRYEDGTTTTIHTNDPGAL